MHEDNNNQDISRDTRGGHRSNIDRVCEKSDEYKRRRAKQCQKGVSSGDTIDFFSSSKQSATGVVVCFASLVHCCCGVGLFLSWPELIRPFPLFRLALLTS
jgi:hypothetical protein